MYNSHTLVVFQLKKHVLNARIEEGVQMRDQSEVVHVYNLMVFLILLKEPTV